MKARVRVRAKGRENRLLSERALGPERMASGRARSAPARSVTVNLAESPLGWLKARGLVDERQVAAGERLRADWERAHLAPRLTGDWGAPPPGPGLSDILWRVVCAGEGMRDAETALGWPARAGRLVLTLALDRLADHYRIG